MNITEASQKDFNKILEEYPLLSRKEERAEFKVLSDFKGGKKRAAAREKIFCSNVRLVLKYANYYHTHSTVPLPDIISSGCEGLMIAIDRFDIKNFKTKFSTYATPWIKLKIIRLLNSFNFSISMPQNIIAKKNKLKKINFNRDLSDGDLTDKEVKEELNLSEKGLHKLKMANATIYNLDAKAYSSEKSDNITTISNLIPDKKVKSADTITIDKEQRKIMHRAMNDLDPIEKEILHNRYLKNDKVNLTKLGKKFNVSGERVRQIEEGALKKMKFKLKKHYYFEGM